MTRISQTDATGSPLDPERLRAYFEAAFARFPEEGLDAADSVCREAPEFAAVVRRRLEMLGRLGLLEEVAEVDDPIPERLGEFRLESRIGGGGMGVVFRATQTSLERPVALKVIHPEHLYFAQTRERFRREIQTLALLRHPGIVPVYAGGDEGGVPFFAMELIDGLTLAEVLSELRKSSREPATPRRAWEILQRDREGEARSFPADWEVDWPTWCLIVTRAIADAVDHAHEQGILHRDLKPSNVMLTRTGRVLIIDFGLATTPGTSTLTRTGSFLGSLPYMPPEQLAGRSDRIDLRTDVYSLGVTLYELLTLQLPYDDAVPTALRQKILSGDRRRPGRFLRGLPAEIETICLVAMEAEPAGRYPTMTALRDDIDRWLREQRVSARRPGLRVTIVRWCVRHPRLASALVLVALAAAAWPVTWRMLDETIETHTASERAAALVADDKARGYFLEIVATFEGLLERIETEHSEQYPDTTALRRQVFQQAVAAYGNIEAQDPDDPLLRRELGRSFRRLARIEYELGNTDTAEEACRRALEFLSALHSEFPEDDDLVYQHALCLDAWAHVQTVLGRDREVLEHVEQAIVLLDPLVERHPDRAAYQALQVNAYRRLGQTHYEHGRPEPGRQAMESALAQLASLEARHPDYRWVETDRGRLLAELGLHLIRDGRAREALRPLQEAELEIQRLVQADPDSDEIQRLHSRVCVNLASALSHTGDWESAIERQRTAVAIHTELRATYPSQWLYGIELASAQNDLGLALDAIGQSEESRRWLMESVATQRAMAESHRDVPVVQARFGATCSGLADSLFGGGRFDEALAYLEEARAPLELARRLEPRGRFMIAADRSSRWLLSLTHTRLNDVERGARIVRELMAEPESDPTDWQQAANYLAGNLNTSESSDRDPELKERLAVEWTEIIVGYLQRAHAEGTLDRSRIEYAADYEILRSRRRFQAFLEELRGQ